MLLEKQITNNTHRQKEKFVTVIHPEKLTKIVNNENDREGCFWLRSISNRGVDSRASLVSWLFLIGSLIFMLDGMIELTEGISIHSIFHNLASLLFTIGSLFFLLDTRAK